MHCSSLQYSIKKNVTTGFNLQVDCQRILINFYAALSQLETGADEGLQIKFMFKKKKNLGTTTTLLG